MKRHPTMAIAAVLARVLDHESRALAAGVPAAMAGDSTAVHDVRVSSRRLREALAIVDAGVDRRAIRRLRRSVRQLERALGPVREADVTRQVLEAAARRHRWDADPVAEIRLALAREDARRRRKMAAALGHVHLRSIARRSKTTAEDVRDRGADGPAWWPLVWARAGARARLVRSAIRASGTRYRPEQLHALRIAAKKLRYTMELVPRGMGAGGPLRQLRIVQRRLGHLHDVQVLLDLVRAAAADDSADRASRMARLADALERDCRRIHAAALPAMSGLGEEIAARRLGRTPH